ncbi:MAG: J domain-containing protein [Flavobacteriales bacterium]|nr:J domain-containing protein [Flavobacteriales bacterium]
MQGTLRYDHYRVLGIPRDASQHEIKRAYRDLVKTCHPDRNDSPQASTLFQAVHAAYETLRDADRRQAYDARLLNYRPVRPGRPMEQEHTFQGKHPMHRDRQVNRFAFVGLHVTGLCFGVSLIGGILVGITFLNWPAYAIVFTIPGAVVIPDSLAGLRTK